MRDKRIHYAILAVIVISILVYTSREEPLKVVEERIRPVRTVEARKTPDAVKQRFAGSTRALSTSSISFRVPGIITEFPAQVGIPLEKSALVARLDSNDYRIKLKQDEAILAREVVDANNSESRFKRIEKLYHENIISEMDYEDSKAEYHINLAEVNQAKRNVELSQEQLSYTELRTPAEGCSVTEAIVAEHENINAGQIVAILSCGDLMEVIAAIPENAVSHISIGQTVETLLNIPREQSFKAEITDIGVSSAANGVYLVTARLIDSDPRLRPGMAAELLLTRTFESAADHVWIPMVAVGEDNGERFVMTYAPVDEYTGTVKRSLVTTDRMVMGLVEVTSGVDGGQQVITAGLSQIQEGLTVKLLKSK